MSLHHAFFPFTCVLSFQTHECVSLVSWLFRPNACTSVSLAMSYCILVSGANTSLAVRLGLAVCLDLAEPLDLAALRYPAARLA